MSQTEMETSGLFLRYYFFFLMKKSFLVLNRQNRACVVKLLCISAWIEACICESTEVTHESLYTIVYLTFCLWITLYVFVMLLRHISLHNLPSTCPIASSFLWNVTCTGSV